MELPLWFVLGVPFGALAFALTGLAWFSYEGRKIDRLSGRHR